MRNRTHTFHQKENRTKYYTSQWIKVSSTFYGIKDLKFDKRSKLNTVKCIHANKERQGRLRKSQKKILALCEIKSLDPIRKSPYIQIQATWASKSQIQNS
ncbi:hypothetical protein Hanom_Chr13g01216261 [Helianthus anomalus]